MAIKDKRKYHDVDDQRRSDEKNGNSLQDEINRRKRAES